MSLNGQQPIALANYGMLTVDIWPVYMGLGYSTDNITLTEEAGHRDYQRGQITWVPQPDGDVIGHARILHPKGVFTHLLFCNGPVEMVVDVEQLEHPYMPDRRGFFDVNVVNKDYVPRR